MRLIDADKLKKDLKSVTLSNGTLVNTNAVLLLLDKYPTAYDVDKVVKQLEENRRAGYNHGYGVGYNEAVSDFVNMFKSRTTMENNLVEEISERLKAGDE